MSAVNSHPPQPQDTPASEPRPGEPSMDDILASIRRIIADDQSRHGPAFRRPPRPEPATPEAAPAPDTAEDLAAAAVPHINPPAETGPAVDEADIDAIAHAGAAAVLRPSFGQAAAQPVPSPDVLAAALPEPPPRAPDPVHATVPPLAPEPPTSERVVDEAAEPLVSPSAAAGIGTSFQALATTVFMQNTAMVEGMMRDMLRPMLKSWLDDNLPSIVERLVRVEIERVARGGR